MDDDFDVIPSTSCRHRPVSNGWSTHSSRDSHGQWQTETPKTWCGHCKSHVYLDREWAASIASRWPNEGSHLLALFDGK